MLLLNCSRITGKERFTMLLSIAAIEVPSNNTTRQAFLFIIASLTMSDPFFLLPKKEFLLLILPDCLITNFVSWYKIALADYFLIRIVVKKAGGIGEIFLNFYNISIRPCKHRPSLFRR